MKKFSILLLSLLLSGCANFLKLHKYEENVQKNNYEYFKNTPVEITHKRIPEITSLPENAGPPVVIAVYSFNDKTGQRKPGTTYADLSSAVTQGAEVFLIKALKDANNGTWFRPVERVGLDDLVKERQLIRSQRELYEGKDAKTLDPLLVAGVVIEGGIVGYDTSIITGGIGARYLGIGLDKQYQVDQVTAVIRLVSISTGEVLLSVGASKTIFSVKSDANVMTFVDSSTQALEMEAGNGANEPTTYAVRMAVEAAVVAMVKEGEKKKLWRYKKGK